MSDYAGHEGVYRRRKEAGAAGWFVEDSEYQGRWLAVIDQVLSQGHAPGGGRLLELGCGAGNLSVWLARRGFEVCGIDISPTAISWARERALAQGVDADFRTGSVVDLEGYQAEAFDVVLDGYCLHCIIGSDRRKCLSSVYRVLRPGGWFLVFTGCRSAQTETLEGYDPISCVVSGEHLPAPRYFAPAESIVQEVSEADFDVAAWETVDIEGDPSLLTAQVRRPPQPV